MSEPLDISRILRIGIEKNASDIKITPHHPVSMRVNGELAHLGATLSAEQSSELVKAICDEHTQIRVAENGGHDFAINVASNPSMRMRCNAYKVDGALAVSIRLLNNNLLNPEQIGLPTIVLDLAASKTGLILVTGPTGSGKSTSLASIVRYVDEHYKARNIITIEDPIEYNLRGQVPRSIIEQRSVPSDTPSFAAGLKQAMREDPDMIVVGEMRDLETIRTALQAAESGHIVFATMHTSGVVSSITRIVEQFPEQEQPAIRVKLAGALSCVVSQVLLPRRDVPGKIAAIECMVIKDNIRANIRKGQTHQLQSYIQTSASAGSKELEEDLADFVRRRIVSEEDALSAAFDTERLTSKLEDG